MWRRWQGPRPGPAEQNRQLTEARAAQPWLAGGSVTVQQQALRVRQDNRRWSAVLVPKVGWVKVRRSRTLPGWKSYRVTRDRVELVPAAYSSQRCHRCGQVDPSSRKSQAEFGCTSCGLRCNADTNAAFNIADGDPAAGRAVAARGDQVKSARSVKREPQLLAS